MAKSRDASANGSYRKTTLKNGLRIITEQIPSVRSFSIGVWVDVGSRNEPPEINGISHFIEHMVFKGTRKRTSRQIAYALESVGGVLNAFTSREQTCFNARALGRHLDLAVDVLADLTCQARFTPVNIEREKLVVCEEIKEALENPSDHIHDLFAQTFWSGHPLGKPILGSIENVLSLSRRDIVSYIKRHYRSESIVVAASGAVSHNKLVDLVRKKLEVAPGSAEVYASNDRGAGVRVEVVRNENEQTHLVFGFPGLSYVDRDKMAALVLSVYLGGGMSSVLFQKIREEKGLAYSVFSYLDTYREGGIVGFYMATDRKKVADALDIGLREIRKVTQRRLSTARLDEVKQQLSGQLMLGMESTAARQNRLARYELMMGDYFTMEHTLRQIERVTPSKVLEIANRVFDESELVVAGLGRASKKRLLDVIRQ